MSQLADERKRAIRMNAAQSRLQTIDALEETRRDVLACVSSCSLSKSGVRRMGASLGAVLLSAWALRRFTFRRSSRGSIAATGAGKTRPTLFRWVEVLLPLALPVVRSALNGKPAGKGSAFDLTNLFFRFLGLGK